jgi:hypothetical protein
MMIRAGNSAMNHSNPVLQYQAVCARFWVSFSVR